MRIFNFTEKRRIVGICIEKLQLALRFKEELVRMLPLDVGKRVAKFPELRERYGNAVNPCPGTSAAVNGATHQHAPGTGLKKIIFLKPMTGGVAQGKFRNDVRPLTSLPHQIRIASTASDELNGINQNRFAGTGLARKHRKA